MAQAESWMRAKTSLSSTKSESGLVSLRLVYHDGHGLGDNCTCAILVECFPCLRILVKERKGQLHVSFDTALVGLQPCSAGSMRCLRRWWKLGTLTVGQSVEFDFGSEDIGHS